MVRIAISHLLATDVALDKLGARGISADDAQQLLRKTLVIERTVDRTTWQIQILSPATSTPSSSGSIRATSNVTTATSTRS